MDLEDLEDSEDFEEIRWDQGWSVEEKARDEDSEPPSKRTK